MLNGEGFRQASSYRGRELSRTLLSPIYKTASEGNGMDYGIRPQPISCRSDEKDKQ